MCGTLFTTGLPTARGYKAGAPAASHAGRARSASRQAGTQAGGRAHPTPRAGPRCARGCAARPKSLCTAARPAGRGRQGPVSQRLMMRTRRHAQSTSCRLRRLSTPAARCRRRDRSLPPRPPAALLPAASSAPARSPKPHLQVGHLARQQRLLVRDFHREGLQWKRSGSGRLAGVAGWVRHVSSEKPAWLGGGQQARAAVTQCKACLAPQGLPAAAGQHYAAPAAHLVGIASGQRQQVCRAVQGRAGAAGMIDRLSMRLGAAAAPRTRRLQTAPFGTPILLRFPASPPPSIQYCFRSKSSGAPVERMKKWPKKAEMRSPLEQRMRITASQAVSRDRLRLRAVAGRGATRQALVSCWRLGEWCGAGRETKQKAQHVCRRVHLSSARSLAPSRSAAKPARQGACGRGWALVLRRACQPGAPLPTAGAPALLLSCPTTPDLPF